jgi:hypothetical protein
MNSLSTPAPKVDNLSRFDGGISDFAKEARETELAFIRSLNYRTDPRKLELLPKTTKESGSIVVDLPKDGDQVGTDVYYYGDTGNIYKRTTAGSHSLLRTVASSHGNGMKYYGEDDFLYYTSDTVIGRYGQINGTPAFVDDFLGSEGGIPLNTHALDLEASSSQYASVADGASLSITGDLAIEAWIKPESLPTAGNSMVLFSKWDINANKRSYKYEIYAVSGYFGDGSDGTLTISGNTTEAPIDSACTGTTGTTSLSATNVSFAAGQVILIHQTQGTGAGTQQKNKISSYTAGTITLETALNATYVSGAQVRVLKQYTTVTINGGVTYTAKAWNGTVGGIIGFLASTSFTGTGTLTSSGKGFVGGSGWTSGDSTGNQGESSTGTAARSTSANGMGGGGGENKSGLSSKPGGGGGGHASTATAGTGIGGSPSGVGGTAGTSGGTADLTSALFGGGGGQGAVSTSGGTGGTGGGYVFVAASTVTITGGVTSAGTAGSAAASSLGGGGGGAGGSVLIKAQTATLGSSLITAAAGTGGAGGGGGEAGGDGSVGRIHLDYYTSYTGTTTPTLDVTLDNSLVTNTTYQLRLGLSSNGTAEEFLTKATTITAGTYFHVGVSWDASTSTATFAQDGVSLGTSTGAVTSLNDNASVAGIGADFNTTARNFFDGLIDEVRLWNTERTVSQFSANKGSQIAVNASGLAAYYKLNNNYDDATASAKHMTATNSPVFTTTVPFSSPTSRQDQDQYLDTSGNTYTLLTSISESAADRQTFVPNRDPQKSIEVNVDTVGTGDWTLTVHDSLNRTVASKTLTNANVHSGDLEFTFSSTWTPIRGASYHFHLTVTTGTSKVVTTTLADMETADFHTYYQFLVTDTDFHPIEQMLNLLAIGNGRYLATQDASAGYDPHRLVFPSGWRVRCFAKWREFLAIGCWKGSSVTGSDKGIIFFWDGSSKTYNFYIEVLEGGINAMIAAKGNLYIWAGYHGEMLVYQGGDGTNDDLKKQIPKMADNKYIETYPKAVSMWDSLLRWGIGGASDSSDVERGIYTQGRRKAVSPVSLSYDYPISTGSRATTNVRIGFIFPIDRKLMIGWRDNVSYGVDIVDPTGSPFATGTIEKSIRDYGRTSKNKQALLVRADFEELATNESVRVKYRLDRSTNWTLGDYVTSGNVARLPIVFGNHKEIEIAADLKADGTTSPALLELTLEEDMKTTETIL